jgi:hypothetical protein
MATRSAPAQQNASATKAKSANQALMSKKNAKRASGKSDYQCPQYPELDDVATKFQRVLGTI